jgi:hypothetical protein
MNYDWKIKEDRENNTISVTLEVDLQKYVIGKAVDPPVKMGVNEAANYLRLKGIKFGKMLKNATVTNRSEKNRRGTWVFELPPKPSAPKKRVSRKKTPVITEEEV